MAHHAAMLSRLVVPSTFAATVCAVGAALALCCFTACAKDATGGSTGTGTDTEAGSSVEAGTETGTEAGSGAEAGTDAGAQSDGSTIVDGPGTDGTVCSFNRDCHAALRCECDETAGCACKPGARGTGRNGIDACTSGNACASSVCVEGPPDAGSFCSDECVTSAQCTGMHPLCTDIAFVGRICIRTPPQ
ncbi:MAG: hypothetical protein QOI41_5708 [Myxococcales bacterium]|nr:hypothetical protein [Myxococcales bacterium]